MKIYLANPRGFCAGVDRAIDIVDLSLKKYGAPIYVRHEIVHSRHVVNSLRQKGAVFVEELNEVPEGSVVIFSAHGVAKSVWEEANRRRLHVIDATCPLVIKVHNEVNRDYNQGYDLILIGHAGHPEVIGTLGQIPDKFHLVSSVKDVEQLHVENTVNLSYVTQTTLSVDECRDIVGALHRRFPNIKGPHQEDICYATQNRQAAVKKIARECDADEVGTCGKELAELHIGRPELGECGRDALRLADDAAPFEQPRDAQRRARRHRHLRRVDHREHALAREHEAGASETREMGDRRDHNFQPECSATTPPVSFS